MKIWGRIALLMGLGLLAVAGVALRPAGAGEQAGQTERVSVSSAGVEGNGHSGKSALSADGRFVAFGSEASNLVSGDTNGVADIFVHERQTGQIRRVSVDSAGVQGNGPSEWPALSADGRFVAFASLSSSLTPGDNNSATDIFVHDRQTGQTTRVSVGSAGEYGNATSFAAAISADGRFVAFYSDASNLVPGDTNGWSDIFVHDRQTGQTTRASVDSAGAQGNNSSVWPALSADGRFVAFLSYATNLVPGDTNNAEDIFVHDRQTGQTTRVSVDSAGVQGNDICDRPSLSADGRFVAFESYASNLISGDTNSAADIFVYDWQTGQTTRVSVNSAGEQGIGYSFTPAISANGRFVAFESYATNLISTDTNNAADIFVHDRQTGQTTRVSVDSTSGQADAGSFLATISGDGRIVAFQSEASDLVPNDSNTASDIFVHDRGGPQPPTRVAYLPALVKQPTPTPTYSPTATYTPTPTHTPTPTNTPRPEPPTATPTATRPACGNVIANGGFEDNANWQINSNEFPAAYWWGFSHSGNRSMRAGIPEPADNRYSYSSFQQTVSIPAPVASARPGYWLYAKTTGTVAALTPPPVVPTSSHDRAKLSDDAQMVLLFDRAGAQHVLTFQRENSGRWVYYEHDLNAFRGQTVTLYFGVYNDGWGGVTAMWVDDAALNGCP